VFIAVANTINTNSSRFKRAATGDPVGRRPEALRLESQRSSDREP
jgi:hypothetical protein